MEIRDYEAKIKSIEEISKDVRILELELDKEINFKAGQYVSLLFESQGKKLAVPYSIASPPSKNKTILFAIKLVSKGKATPYLWDKKENDILKLKGPLGSFGIKESDKENLVFIGTGTGIAPLKSMIEDLLEKNTLKSLTLIFGERYENEILFEKEFQYLENQHKNFKFIRVISKPSKNYKGKTGHVQENLNEVDFKNMDAYLCGMPQMVEEVKEKLIQEGVPKENIFMEKY